MQKLKIKIEALKNPLCVCVQQQKIKIYTGSGTKEEEGQSLGGHGKEGHNLPGALSSVITQSVARVSCV